MAALRTEFPTIRVEAHGGRFTATEIPLWLGKAPCLLVAPLAIAPFNQYNLAVYEATVQWTCYAFMTDRTSHSRDDAVLEMVQALMGLVLDNRWGIDCQPAQDVQADNLYTGEQDNLRVSLWAVSWSQAVFLSSSED